MTNHFKWIYSVITIYYLSFCIWITQLSLNANSSFSQSTKWRLHLEVIQQLICELTSAAMKPKKLPMHIFSIIIGIPLNQSIFSRSYNMAWFETSLALHKHINIKPLQLQQDKNQSYKACGVVYTTTLKLVIKMCTFDLLHKIFSSVLIMSCNNCINCIEFHFSSSVSSIYQLASLRGNICKLFVFIFLILFVTFSQIYS